jgi:hypothetical protein
VPSKVDSLYAALTAACCPGVRGAGCYVPLAPLLRPLLPRVLYIQSTPRKLYPSAVLTGLPTPAVYRTQERLYLYDLLVLVCVCQHLGLPWHTWHRNFGVCGVWYAGKTAHILTVSACACSCLCSACCELAKVSICRSCCDFDVFDVQTDVLTLLAVGCPWSLVMITVDLARAPRVYCTSAVQLHMPRWQCRSVLNCVVCVHALIDVARCLSRPVKACHGLSRPS